MFIKHRFLTLRQKLCGKYNHKWSCRARGATQQEAVLGFSASRRDDALDN